MEACLRHTGKAEAMVRSGHYGGGEVRGRAYSVLEAATALHDTTETGVALLGQAGAFYRLASTVGHE